MLETVQWLRDSIMVVFGRAKLYKSSLKASTTPSDDSLRQPGSKKEFDAR